MLDRICFVCQSGRLEFQAVLLAASLRLHFPPGIALVAAHPTEHGALRDETVRALRALDVQIQAVRNPLAPDYLIGHKLAAMALLEGSSLGMILDSDVVAMSTPDHLGDAVAAVAATWQHVPLRVWRHVYDGFGLPFPRRGPPTLVSREKAVPYYNSGVVAVPGQIAGSLASTWIATAREIDEDHRLGPRAKRPWLDQVALPIAAARLGIEIRDLDARWNYPSWVWRIGKGARPIFFHYQKFARLAREECTREAVMRAIATRPEVDAAIGETLARDLQSWKAQSFVHRRFSGTRLAVMGKRIKVLVTRRLSESGDPMLRRTATR